ncbi:MAG: aminotransferase class V-fold PLP-dependent enzyme [Acidobacteriota bacterium]
MIYLDHGATSFPKAPGVSAAVTHFIDEASGNPGRGGHRLTIAASRAIEEARTTIAGLLDSDPERTLLGPSATFWLNTILCGRLGPGDRVVTTALEHNAVMRPLRWLESRRGVEVAVVEGAAHTGVPTAREIQEAVDRAPTALVILSHASNVSGAIVPVEAIARRIEPTPVVVDGAQTAGALPVAFSLSGLAAFVCSGHKGLQGPPGIGVVLLEGGFELQPLIRGGTGSRSESEEMPAILPDLLEAGTPNGPGIAGLGAACTWLADRTVEAIQRHERTLINRCITGMRAIPGLRLAGWVEGMEQTGVLSFTIDGEDVGELAAWLDRDRGIALRAGLHCAPAAHRRLGTFPTGTLRVGVGPQTTEDDVDALVVALEDRCG